MQRSIFCSTVIFLIFGFLWSCAHIAIKNENVFTDNETEKRVGYLQEKLRTYPDNIEIHLEIGKIFLSEGMTEDAVKEFERILSVEPRHIETYLLLSLSLQKCLKPDLQKAAILLEKASQIAPDNADIHLNLAQIYDKQKAEEMALREFNKAIELTNEPRMLVSAHLGLMAIYKRHGELKKAEEEYNASYVIYPGIEDIIKHVEINRMTPAPGYTSREGGSHPLSEERIKRIKEEIRKMSGGEK